MRWWEMKKKKDVHNDYNYTAHHHRLWWGCDDDDDDDDDKKKSYRERRWERGGWGLNIVLPSPFGSHNFKAFVSLLSFYLIFLLRTHE